MKEYTASQLAAKALQSDAKCIGDRLYFQAWCIAFERFGELMTEQMVQNEYGKLLRRTDPFSLERERERYLDHNLDMKGRAESTNALKRKLLNGEEGLFV